MRMMNKSANIEGPIEPTNRNLNKNDETNQLTSRLEHYALHL